MRNGSGVENICVSGLQKSNFFSKKNQKNFRNFWKIFFRLKKSSLRRNARRGAKKGRRHPKKFLGVKWVHKTPGRKSAPNFEVSGRNSASNVKIFDQFYAPRTTSWSKIRRKLAEKQHLLIFFSAKFSMFHAGYTLKFWCLYHQYRLSYLLRRFLAQLL